MWSPIAKYLSQKCYETRILSYKGKIKTIILIFSVPKSQNWLTMSVTMTTPIHVKDKNSIFTAHDEDMIFW